MKKHLFSLLFCLPLFVACSDYIPEEERYILLEDIECKRNILIEDFTGQECSNCPEAHQVINNLQALYGDHVVAVAIHAGYFGIAEGSKPNIVGLMQPDGNSYAEHWRIAFYPAGLINRTSGLLKHTDWAVYARQELVREPQAAINLTAEIVNDSIIINTDVQSTNCLNAKLQLWITESNITAKQRNGKVEDTEYRHNHVYRASVNGLWGQDIALNANEPVAYRHSIALRSNWNTASLSVVAFVYTDTDGVMEVTELHL